MAKAKHKSDNTIAVNKKARHDYFIEENIEAGIALEGWEVKRKLCTGKKYGSLATWCTHQSLAFCFYA